METNYSKVILKTARNTFISIAVLLVIIIGSLTVFSPVSLAKLTSSLGLNNMSIYYYQLNYNKTSDINDLYILLNKSITASNNSKTIESFEELYDSGSETYYDFIDYVNNFNLNSTSNNSYKLYLANEDARLKGKYISSLIAEDEMKKALDFGALDFYYEAIDSIDDNINFILGDYMDYLIENDAINAYFDELKNYSYLGLEEPPVNLINESFIFYADCRTIFDAGFEVTGNSELDLEQSIYANSLIKILNTLITIDDMTETSLNIVNLTAERDDLLTKLQLLI